MLDKLKAFMVADGEDLGEAVKRYIIWLVIALAVAGNVFLLGLTIYMQAAQCQNSVYC